jgi:hypothetical protein
MIASDFWMTLPISLRHRSKLQRNGNVELCDIHIFPSSADNYISLILYLNVPFLLAVGFFFCWVIPTFQYAWHHSKTSNSLR